MTYIPFDKVSCNKDDIFSFSFYFYASSDCAYALNLSLYNATFINTYKETRNSTTLRDDTKGKVVYCYGQLKNVDETKYLLFSNSPIKFNKGYQLFAGINIYKLENPLVNITQSVSSSYITKDQLVFGDYNEC